MWVWENIKRIMPHKLFKPKSFNSKKTIHSNKPSKLIKNVQMIYSATVVNINPKSNKKICSVPLKI